ncbi:MAG: hypothetical protein V1708_03820 [Candidatus Micrarchaeota archaeon]
MNKLFAVIGILTIMASMASALIICYNAPTKGDDTGKVLLGGGSEITINAADEDGKAISFGSDGKAAIQSYIIEFKGADSETKASNGDVSDKAYTADEDGKAISFGADSTPRMAATGDDEGKTIRTPVLYESGIV